MFVLSVKHDKDILRVRAERHSATVWRDVRMQGVLVENRTFFLTVETLHMQYTTVLSQHNVPSTQRKYSNTTVQALQTDTQFNRQEEKLLLYS